MKTYPIILDACINCPDKDKCHRTFAEVVACKRTDTPKECSGDRPCDRDYFHPELCNRSK